MAKKYNVLLLQSRTMKSDREFARGFIKFSQLHGHWNIHTSVPFYRNPSGHKTEYEEIRNSNIDGIIANVPSPNCRVAKLIRQSHLPAVILPAEKIIPGYPNIFDVPEETGKMAAQYFTSKGFYKFAFCGYRNLCWSDARLRDFRKYLNLRKHKLFVYEEPNVKGLLSFEKEFPYLIKWLKTLPKPIALFAVNDDRGFEVIKACKASNIAVPEQIAVLGVDDDEFVCEISEIPLSSISLGLRKTGFEAAKLLHKMMKNKTIQEQLVYLKPKYVVTRRSTDIIAIEDEAVADSLTFINENSSEDIKVSDVLDSIIISRRNLEQRFKKSLNRTIYDEIKRVRVENIKKLLLETNYSISQIAKILNFKRQDHLWRLFKEQTKLTPGQYRKQNAGV